MTPTPLTGNYGILEAVSTAAAAVVVLGGAVVGIRYGRKAINIDVKATAYRDDEGIVLVVRPTISSAGVLPVKLAKDAVVIRAFEIVRAPTGGLERGQTFRGSTGGFSEDTIRGKESKSAVEMFPVTQRPRLVGWLAVAAVTYKGDSWAAGTFQPVPAVAAPVGS